jgi:dihydroxyacetone kinase
MMNLAIVLQILSQHQELTKQGCILEAAIEAGAKELIALKDSLNDWDSKVGDGDCGTTVGLVGICQLNADKSCFKIHYN